MNSNPVLSIIYTNMGENDLEILNNKVARLSDEIEINVITDKSKTNPIHGLNYRYHNKNYKNINEFIMQLIQQSSASYFLIQNTGLSDIQFDDVIHRIYSYKFSLDILTLTEFRNNKIQNIIDMPFLFHGQDFDNLIFKKDILINSYNEKSLYNWKIDALLDSQLGYNLKIESNLKERSIEETFLAINNFISQINNIKINKYIKKDLICAYYEKSLKYYIGPAYKKVLINKNSKDQSRFLKQIDKMIKNIDIELINSIPALRYYFIQLTIDHYKFIKYKAKRVHLSIMRYLYKNMDFHTYKIYIKKYNKLFPAAIRAIKVKNSVPIYLYLIRRKLKKKVELHRVKNFSKPKFVK
ncbi:hypothetical protein [Terrilactibacillus laevilacticus]|uniref:hypothetical protein n=1 Tax=Terrilactibacillus laevilacticus TaxID=1380157 RepID=UPI001146C536|nr:hypothetical protein [Terrilactibacillus laevilacticus]